MGDPNYKSKKQREKEKAEEEQLRKVSYEVGEKAGSESGMVISQAQRLFYEIWNQRGYKMSIKEGVDHFRKCMDMAEEIREIAADDFKTRIKKAQEDFEQNQTEISPDGVRRIIIPSGEDWAQHRLQTPGRIAN